ncbi:YPO3983 family protein [Symbiopectobacterium purcellii]|uniref:YPO3983 family protein n=1 Tax=Symbiopectobacterium purcellii TaxID=2871826 RepID=UPI003F8432AB
MSHLTPLSFPFTAFCSEMPMNDYSAPDMKCGDLTEIQLKNDFKLSFVSFRVDPYKNERKCIFAKSKSISDEQLITELFDEFRFYARVLSFGPYSGIIQKMILNFRNNKGDSFSSPLLDKALNELILNDKRNDSIFNKIKSTINEHIDWDQGFFPDNKKEYITKSIAAAKSLEFTRLKDTFNGLGLAVHGISSLIITVQSIFVKEDKYYATINFQAQDHFGLDDSDILDVRFHNFMIFRIWFILQRWNKFSFKPFMTNMQATVVISEGKSNYI